MGLSHIQRSGRGGQNLTEKEEEQPVRQRKTRRVKGLRRPDNRMFQEEVQCAESC